MIESGWTRDTFKRWLLFGLLAAAAVLLNANGVRGVFHPFTIAGMKTLTLIEEWRPSNLSQTPWFFAGLLGTLGAIMLRGGRMRVGETALLLLMLAMAFHQVRHQSWLAIVAVLIVPPAIARSVGDRPLHRRAPRAAAAALAFALILARLALPSSPSENSANPRRLLAAVPEELRTKPLLNGYSMGGPLILAGIRPYIDGRADMYRDDFFLDYQKIVDGDMPRFRRAVDRYGIRWTMLPHSHERLIRGLDQTPEWRRHYWDDVGVIHIRSRPERRPGARLVMPAN